MFTAVMAPDDSEDFVRMVAAKVRSSFPSRLERADMEQEGRIAMFREVGKKADGVPRARAYYFKVVRCSMLDAINESAGPVSMPPAAMYHSRKRSASRLRAHASRVRSMGCVPVTEETLVSEGDPTADEVHRRETIGLVRESVATLTQAEKAVIEGLFGLDGKGGRPSEVAAYLGITYNELVALRKRAVRKLRMWLVNKGVDGDDCRD